MEGTGLCASRQLRSPLGHVFGAGERWAPHDISAFQPFGRKMSTQLFLGRNIEMDGDNEGPRTGASVWNGEIEGDRNGKII